MTHATLGGEATAALDVRQTVLVVDLDGTLLTGDVLVEQVLWLAARRPLALVALLFAWLRRPTPLALKQRLAAETGDLPLERLPYRPAVLARIRQARDAGREVVLATASLAHVADGIARHLGLFDAVIASRSTNLHGADKLEALRAHLGERPFEYVGDHARDRPLWAAARVATVVATPSGAHRLYPPAARTAGQPVHLIEAPRASWRTWFKALRVHQWSKNLLVLLPVLAGQRVGDADLVLRAGLAAVGASCLASAVYLTNDLLDVHADRASTSARVRPIADGSIPYALAGVTAVLLALLAFVIGAGLQAATGAPVLGLLVAYALANVLYSTGLKRVMMLDIMLLSTLYLWRIVLGSVTTGIVLSDWLLAFSVFFFLGLACAKRCIELAAHGAPPTPSEAERSGRGYVSADLPVLRVIGIGSALVSVLVLALYLKDDQTAALYSRPQWLWGVVLLELYWVTRLWLLVSRGVVSSDPVEFATRDRPTYLVAVLALLALVLAR